MRMAGMLAVALTALVGCEGPGGSDRDLPDAAEAPADSSEPTDEGPSCLGGRPSLTVETLRWDGGQGTTWEWSPFLTGAGAVVPGASGGWLILGGTQPCGTDIATSAVVRLGPDGAYRWGTAFVGSTMGGWDAIPEAVLPLDDGFLLVEGPTLFGNGTARLRALNDDGTGAWAIEAAALGRPRRLVPVERPGDPDLYFVATLTGDAFQDPAHDLGLALLRVTRAGALALAGVSFDLGGGSFQASPGHDGVDVLVDRVVSPGDGQAVREVVHARLPWDGTAADPVVVASWPSSEGRPYVRVDEVLPAGSGWVVQVDPPAPAVIRVAVDGTTPWTREAPLGGSFWLPGPFRILPDGWMAVGCAARVSPDGRDVVLPGSQCPAPPGGSASWQEVQIVPVTDGWLAAGAVDPGPDAAEGAPAPVRAVVARYASDGTLRWARDDGPGLSALRLAGDAWVVATTRESDGPACTWNPDPARTTTLRFFDGLCE